MKSLNDIPDFHDGYLVGLNLIEPNQLEIKCRTVNNINYRIILPSIMRVKADNFCEGNIIFEINIYHGKECNFKLYKKIQSDGMDRDDALFSEFEKLNENNWTMFELTASYGCELLVLLRNNPEEIIFEKLKS